MLYLFAGLFIFYELLKIVSPEKYINIFSEMKMLLDTGGTRKILESNYANILIVEIAYLIFVIILFFTSHWYVGIAIFVLSLMLNNKSTPREMIFDGVITIAILSLIFIM